MIAVRVPKISFPRPMTPDFEQLRENRSAEMAIQKTVDVERKNRKAFKRFWGVVGLLFLLNVLAAIPANKTAASYQDVAQSEKYDGDCTGQETQGRCADKCLDTQNLIGYEENGAAICEESRPVETNPVPVLWPSDDGGGK